MASSSSSSSPEIHHAHSHNTLPAAFSFQCATESEVLEELSNRFILNLPDEELGSVERVCFQVEQAHWFYEDFIRERNPKLPSLPLKKFSAQLFAACPLLRQWSFDHEQTFNTFMQYKTRVPVCGAIMLNAKWDKCVLVKGWKSSSGWGFPKGKINQDEEPHKCAIREVLEETGFDLSTRLKTSDHIEMTIKEQRITLYVVGGVPEDYPFQTRTRKEISKIEWFNLNDLPTWRRNKQASGKFYLISPFVPPLKEFVRVNKSKRNRQGRGRTTVDTSVDLSIQTDYDNDKEEVLHGDRETFDVVRLDRGAQGSSSSSADNNDPSTPSPLSVTAMPVVVESAGGADSEVGLDLGSMDPHLARLLAGLSSSASGSTVKEDTQPTVTTDAIVDRVESGPDPSVESRKHAKQGSRGESVAPAAKSTKAASPTSLLSTTPHQMEQSATTPAPSSSVVMVDRHLKHLALLESVASESSTLSSGLPGVHEISGHLPHDVPFFPIRTFPSNAVPPTRLNTRSIPPHPSSNLSPPSMRSIHVPMFGQQPLVHANSDSFTVRPLTSQASSLPSSLSPRRHGLNVSMHQGQLLNILGGPTGPTAPVRIPPPQFQPPHVMNRALGGPGVMYTPHFNGISPQIPTQAPAPQPLRVVPPPPSAFSNNLGPLSASMGVGPSNVNASMTGSPAVAPERVQRLLSLFQSTNTAPPTSILTAGTTRPNYLPGSPAVKVPSHLSPKAVSNTTFHR